MASTFFFHLRNLWPFSMLKLDDLKISIQLVQKLSISEQTKQFVFAVKEPDSNAVVYFLAAQNLSEQSAFDAENLIKDVQPKAVVAQVGPSALNEIQIEERNSTNDRSNNIPTSSVGVLKRCLTEKINKEQYDKFAGFQVLHEIFGIGFYGHFFAAKRAAEEVRSHFLLLESPYENSCTPRNGDKSSALDLQETCILPGKYASSVSNSLRFCLTDSIQSQMLKLLLPSLELSLQTTNSSNSISEANPCESKPIYATYDAPPFAESVYPLLVDLYEIFNDLPAIRKALISAQEMLMQVNHGKPVETHLLSEAHNFRIAIEGLRIALNNAAHCPVDKMKPERELEFCELPSDEKCHVLFVQALRNQARKFGGPIVAIVDAGRLAGIRKHWRTSVPPEIAELANQCFTHDYTDIDSDDDDEDEIFIEPNTGKKSLLVDKPVVAVGAGATAVIGATSLSKAVPASTLFKITTYKLPAILKISLANLKRQACIGFSKILGPSKILAPGFTSVGAKTSTTLKLAASAEKIRAATHGMIAYGQRTSLLAVRTSFYEIMRRRKNVGLFRLAPWATFGCSVAACSGLIFYGDGIECAAESIPSVPKIASLGRGIQSLQQASHEVRDRSSLKRKEALQTMMHKR